MVDARNAAEMAREAITSARRCLREIPTSYDGRDHLSATIDAVEDLVVRLAPSPAAGPSIGLLG